MVLWRFEGHEKTFFVAAAVEVEAIRFVEEQGLDWDEDWDGGSPEELNWCAPSDDPEVMFTNHVINSMEERGAEFPCLAIDEDFPDECAY